jgi:Subtilase family/GEVED domain
MADALPSIKLSNICPTQYITISMKNYLLILLLVCLGSQTFAQQSLYTGKQFKAIQQHARQVETSWQSRYDQAIAVAKEKGWIITETRPDGTTVALQGLTPNGHPIYYRTYSNAKAAATTQTTSLYQGGSLGQNLNGSSTQMSGRLGIWDGGAVLKTHQELTGRITQGDSPSSTDAHATHTSGTMIATGINSLARGMAFGAKLKAYDFNNDATEMARESSALLISNHSYGAYTGWSYNSTRNNWEWWGDDAISITEDYKFGFYTDETSLWDKMAYNAPYYLPVMSAGNERNTAGPSKGAYYFIRNTKDSSNVARKQSLDYDLIDTKGNAKNCLTVGAVSATPDGVNSPADIKMSGFSSWGPTDDGRIKPDLVGVGVSVLSTTNTSNTAYATLSGTSMSSPQVAGSLFLLQELYSNLNDKQFMRAATLKGIAIHTAEEAGTTPGPDYAFGWGLLNIEKAAKVILNTDKSYYLAERQLTQGDVYTQKVVASGKVPLSVTISWTDPEADATLVNKANLNSRTSKLVNDLDIRVSDGTNIILPWVLDPNNPSKAATKGDNIRDNVENIFIPDAVPGKTYIITVSHKGTLQRSPQNYTLIASGIGGVAYCMSKASDKADSKITKVSFGDINYAGTTDCADYTDLTKLSMAVSVGQTIPLEIELGTCGMNNAKIAKVFVDWNSDADFDDANELVATSPVITQTGTFTTAVAVPSGVVVGNNALMRIVCTETNSPTAITACGTYTKGETQDYLLKIVVPQNDVGIVSLVSPEQNDCAGTIKKVVVKIKNYGSTAQSNLPVTMVLTSPNGTQNTFMGTYTGTLAAYTSNNLTLIGNMNTEVNTTYQATITINQPDQDAANNILATTLSIAPLNANPIGTGYFCNDELNVKAEGNGTIYWYDAPTFGKLLAVGNTAVLQPKPTNNVIYAALNDFSGTVGPQNKAVFPTGGYNQFTPSVKVTTYVPVMLESARLYIGNAGQIIFTVSRESDGAIISTTTLDVTPTRTPAADGAQTDDPTDVGQVYPLNLSIPVAGNYLISIAYQNGATIFRNKDNIKGYPFMIPNVMAITGTDVTPPSDPLQYYYYFYNLQVKSLGCVATARTPITAVVGIASIASISPSSQASFCAGGSVNLSANTAQSYQWYKDQSPVIGATQIVFSAKANGTYTVATKENGKCATMSSAVVVTTQALPVRPDITKNDNLLTTNSSGDLQWYFNNIAILNTNVKSIVATQTGVYQVQTTQNGCLAVSDNVTIVITAIDDYISEGYIYVYPNPVDKGIVYIRYVPTNAIQTAEATLFDNLGKVIKKFTLNKQSTYLEMSIDSQVIPLGVNILEIIDGNGIRVMKKIIR